MTISLLAYVATFSGQLYFWKNCFFMILHNNCFDRAATFSEQLFLQDCYIFLGASFSEQLPLRNSYFFRIATSSEQDFYQAATS